MRQHEALDRWFRLLFESSPDGFILIDSAGTIAAANPMMVSLLGHAPHELVGSAAVQILPSLDLTAARREVDARHRDGALVPVEVVLTAFAAEGERWLLARLSRRPSRANEATPAILRAEFLSVLMHELRTPLQTMLGWAQHLRAGPRDPATLDQGLTTIERNIRWQAEVLEDLIEMSRLVSGELRLDLRPTRVRSVIEAAVDRIEAMARERDIRLAWAPDSLAHEIHADATCLVQVIAKLLANAIRFTSPGGVVAIRVQQVADSIRITIADDGQGHDPGLSHTSTWFRSGAPSTLADFTGFGVGLANVQRVVEMHGGQVEAESTGPGRETRFSVVLPLVAAPR